MGVAAIGLGGNLGDVLGAFARARAGLDRDGAHVLRSSSAYRTPAMTLDGSSGPDFWNAALVIATGLSAREILDRLLLLEAREGRVRRERWAARPLDLDLLLYDGRAIREPGLTVPHPGLRERYFVLAPLVEIAPDVLVPPDGATVRALYQALTRAHPNERALEVLPTW